MTFRVRLSSLAKADLDAALDYIHSHSPERARRWLDGLENAISSLKTLPQRCPVIPEADELGITMRHLLYGQRAALFRIVFYIEEDEVFVLRIWHGSRHRLTIEDLEE
jgi:toxin ParE1/3/4